MAAVHSVVPMLLICCSPCCTSAALLLFPLLFLSCCGQNCQMWAYVSVQCATYFSHFWQLLRSSLSDPASSIPLFKPNEKQLEGNKCNNIEVFFMFITCIQNISFKRYLLSCLLFFLINRIFSHPVSTFMQPCLLFLFMSLALLNFNEVTNVAGVTWRFFG